MTDSETLTAITAGFSAEGYDTPQKVTDFVRASVRQMKVVIGGAELAILSAEQSAAQTTAQAAREAKTAQVNGLASSLSDLIRSLAQGQA